jgi:hypothetical protein
LLLLSGCRAELRICGNRGKIESKCQYHGVTAAWVFKLCELGHLPKTPFRLVHMEMEALNLTFE